MFAGLFFVISLGLLLLNVSVCHGQGTVYNCLDSRCSRYCVALEGSFTPGVCNAGTIVTCNADLTVNSASYSGTGCSPANLIAANNFGAPCRPALAGVGSSFWGASELTSCTLQAPFIASTFNWTNVAATTCAGTTTSNPSAALNPCCQFGQLNYRGCSANNNILNNHCLDLDILNYPSAGATSCPTQAGVSALLAYLDQHNCWSGVVAKYVGGSQYNISSKISMIQLPLAAGCTIPFNVDGGLSDWANVGSCNNTCGVGSVTQQRTCTNPAPQQNGATCVAQGLGPLQREQSCTSYTGCTVSSTAAPAPGSVSAAAQSSTFSLLPVILLCGVAMLEV